MAQRLVGWLLGISALLTSVHVFAREPPAEPGAPFQTVVEMETTARLLAILLDSGRAVINENQDGLDRERAGRKRLTPAFFEQELIEVFRSRSGLDLRDLDTGRAPSHAKKLLPVLVAMSKEVVAQFPSGGDPHDGRATVLIPAVFGSRAAGLFSQATGVRLKQTSLSPRNPANSPDSFEKATLEVFADPSYPREQSISEVTAKSRSLRLMYPLYTTRQCLACHGGPKGELDKTGYPREGLRLGQNAGAISVMMPLGPQ